MSCGVFILLLIYYHKEYFSFVAGYNYSIQNSNPVWHIMSQIYRGYIWDVPAVKRSWDSIFISLTKLGKKKSWKSDNFSFL